MKDQQKRIPYGMIAILFFGAFIAFLNNTLLNIAIPTIMEEFSVEISTAQWLTTGFMLVNGILIPASAFFVQRFTNRALFISAMAFFTAGTALAMVAPTFLLLVAGRMLQAAGSALMMPLLMNIMLVTFPIEKRGSAMGVFGLVMITAPAIGPTLSGWVIEHYSWRTLFGIVLPFAIFILLVAIFKLKNVMETKHVQLDIFSLMLSSIGFGGILYGFSAAGENGWTHWSVYGTIAIGSIALTIFIIRQLRMTEPLLDLRIYRYPMFALSSVISVVISVSMFSAMILTPLYVQNIRGISPFESGILMLPGAIIMGIMSPITGKLFDKYGPKALALTGLTITVLTTFLLSRLGFDDGYYYIMAVYTARMFGMSMVMMPIMTNGLNQLPMESNPHGTAINNTLQQVSGAIGSAILLTITTKHTQTKMTELQSTAMIPSDPTEASQMMFQIAQEATLSGINHTFFLSTVIAALALLLTFFVKRVPTS
ncbi:DHA2 family efflux MFS transporter permease subunit [Savagea sp. SN6]|uniref:DHA2 family efflux MFS transporter permease subunit n=1 Tax=Savagea serpentis TaxID=2785297 RepID=A0A8J7GD26_9BACL|nr:DHA2 family efflux MFS transporter permease subunit [Savagea serpentis]MBF4501501.1 DHA2 family efflux MFS transporter permease subunit [Savagea serpentis]